MFSKWTTILFTLAFKALIADKIPLSSTPEWSHCYLCNKTNIQNLCSPTKLTFSQNTFTMQVCEHAYPIRYNYWRCEVVVMPVNIELTQWHTSDVWWMAVKNLLTYCDLLFILHDVFSIQASTWITHILQLENEKFDRNKQIQIVMYIVIEFCSKYYIWLI